MSENQTSSGFPDDIDISVPWLDEIDQRGQLAIERLWDRYQAGDFPIAASPERESHLSMIPQGDLMVKETRGEKTNMIEELQVQNFAASNLIGNNFMGYTPRGHCFAFRGEKRHLDTFLNFAYSPIVSEHVEARYKPASEIKFPEEGLVEGLNLHDFSTRVEIVEFAIWLKQSDAAEDLDTREGTLTILSVVKDGMDVTSLQQTEIRDDNDALFEDEETSSHTEAEEAINSPGQNRINPEPVINVDYPEPAINVPDINIIPPSVREPGAESLRPTSWSPLTNEDPEEWEMIPPATTEPTLLKVAIEAKNLFEAHRPNSYIPDNSDGITEVLEHLKVSRDSGKPNATSTTPEEGTTAADTASSDIGQTEEVPPSAKEDIAMEKDNFESALPSSNEVVSDVTMINGPLHDGEKPGFALYASDGDVAVDSHASRGTGTPNSAKTSSAEDELMTDGSLFGGSTGSLEQGLLTGIERLSPIREIMDLDEPEQAIALEASKGGEGALSGDTEGSHEGDGTDSRQLANEIPDSQEDQARADMPQQRNLSKEAQQPHLPDLQGYPNAAASDEHGVFHGNTTKASTQGGELKALSEVAKVSSGFVEHEEPVLRASAQSFSAAMNGQSTNAAALDVTEAAKKHISMEFEAREHQVPVSNHSSTVNTSPPSEDGTDPLANSDGDGHTLHSKPHKFYSTDAALARKLYEEEGIRYLTRKRSSTQEGETPSPTKKLMMQPTPRKMIKVKNLLRKSRNQQCRPPRKQRSRLPKNQPSRFPRYQQSRLPRSQQSRLQRSQQRNKRSSETERGRTPSEY